MRKFLFIVFFVFFSFISIRELSAASGVVRPDGDSSVQWTSTGTSNYTELTSTNDLVTQPTTPNINDYVDNNGNQNNVDRYSMDNSLTDVCSASAVNVWIYCYGSKSGDIKVNLYWGGTVQEYGQVSCGTSYGWQNASFTSLGLTQTQLDSLEVEITGGQGGRTFYVAALYADVTYSPLAISISTDGSVSFGNQNLDTTQDTTSGGLNDSETIQVDCGPVDLDIKSSSFTDGSNIWSLGSSSNGSEQVFWEFSKDETNWTTFAAADTLYSFDTNVSTSSTRSLYLRLTTPTSTSSYNQHSSTVTIVASAP